jgi:hypothetical protein
VGCFSCGFFVFACPFLSHDVHPYWVKTHTSPAQQHNPFAFSSLLFDDDI